MYLCDPTHIGMLSVVICAYCDIEDSTQVTASAPHPLSPVPSLLYCLYCDGVFLSSPRLA